MKNSVSVFVTATRLCLSMLSLQVVGSKALSQPLEPLTGPGEQLKTVGFTVLYSSPWPQFSEGNVEKIEVTEDIIEKRQHAICEFRFFKISLTGEEENGYPAEGGKFG